MKKQLAAILHGDVAGYSRMTGRDEMATHQRLADSLQEFSRAISAHGGKKINEAGDAVLAEFSSVVEAVQAAVDFQTGMAETNRDAAEDDRFEFRVGIHLGEVIESEGDIFGDDVNIAARIQSMSEPGGLSVSASVREQVRDKVDVHFYDLGFQSLKNISSPVHVYAASIESMSGRDHPVDFLARKVESQPLFGLDSQVPAESVSARGGCLCGRVAFQVRGDAAGAGFCHCRMCQKSIGAAINAWVAFASTDVEFDEDKPTWYRTSAIAERGFCSTCGTSLCYRLLKPEVSRFLIVNLPTLDNPSMYTPTWHGGIESQLPWIDIHDELPRMQTSESPALRQAWESAGVFDPLNWRTGSGQD